jgi:hypothetical protein
MRSFAGATRQSNRQNQPRRNQGDAVRDHFLPFQKLKSNSECKMDGRFYLFFYGYFLILNKLCPCRVASASTPRIVAKCTA